jgi:glycosyltransferase involved in cell wall biosynthesis
MLLPETLKLHDKVKFEFHYIYFLPWKNQMVESIEKNGGIVHCMSASNNLQIIFKLRAIIEYIRLHNIQLIHCHLPWAGMVGRIVFKIINVPVLYTEHNKQERYHFLTRWMNRLTFNWQSTAIAVSHDVAESIHKNINPRVPVLKILNGVNTNFFQRDEKAGGKFKQELGLPENSIVVGAIAVFRFQKRMKEWLEVFAAASAKHPQLYGIIVGDGPLKEEILKHRKQLGLEEKVLMPGLQTDVKPWYSAMNIFMMTSVFEGLPIALLEAMSMECAVVTTDAGGIKEVIERDQSGLMKGVDDWKELSDDLSNLVMNEGLRNALAHAGRARVKVHFGMEKMVGELEKLYDSYQLPAPGDRKLVTGNKL